VSFRLWSVLLMVVDILGNCSVGNMLIVAFEVADVFVL
jgi:hypothetical protein